MHYYWMLCEGGTASQCYLWVASTEAVKTMVGSPERRCNRASRRRGFCEAAHTSLNSDSSLGSLYLHATTDLQIQYQNCKTVAAHVVVVVCCNTDTCWLGLDALVRLMLHLGS